MALNLKSLLNGVFINRLKSSTVTNDTLHGVEIFSFINNYHPATFVRLANNYRLVFRKQLELRNIIFPENRGEYSIGFAATIVLFN